MTAVMLARSENVPGMATKKMSMVNTVIMLKKSFDRRELLYFD